MNLEQGYLYRKFCNQILNPWSCKRKLKRAPAPASQSNISFGGWIKKEKASNYNVSVLKLIWALSQYHINSWTLEKYIAKQDKIITNNRSIFKSQHREYEQITSHHFCFHILLSVATIGIARNHYSKDENLTFISALSYTSLPFWFINYEEEYRFNIHHKCGYRRRQHIHIGDMLTNTGKEKLPKSSSLE